MPGAARNAANRVRARTRRLAGVRAAARCSAATGSSAWPGLSAGAGGMPEKCKGRGLAVEPEAVHLPGVAGVLGVPAGALGQRGDLRRAQTSSAAGLPGLRYPAEHASASACSVRSSSETAPLAARNRTMRITTSAGSSRRARRGGTAARTAPPAAAARAGCPGLIRSRRRTASLARPAANWPGAAAACSSRSLRAHAQHRPGSRPQLAAADPALLPARLRALPAAWPEPILQVRHPGPSHARA